MVEDEAHIDEGQRDSSREQGFSAGGMICVQIVLTRHGVLGVCDGHVLGNDSVTEGLFPYLVRLAL
jgi:hypothetical protein